MRLKKLILRNWVCHKYTEIEFKPGTFVIITGTNGAGKSVILEAIRFLFGSNIKLRGSKWSDYITYGERNASVEGVFEDNEKTITVSREVRWSEKGSDIQYLLNGKHVSKKDVLDLLKRYLPDPDNPFIIADSNSLHLLRDHGALGYSPENLLRYLEKGIYVEQLVLRDGKKEIARMSLEDLRNHIKEQYEKVEDKIRIFEEIKSRLMSENERLKLLESKLKKLKERKKLEEKIRELEVEKALAEINEKREEISWLKDKLNELSKEKEEKLKELEKVDKRIRKLEKEREQLLDEKTELENRKMKLEGKKESLKKIILEGYQEVQIKENRIKEYREKLAKNTNILKKKQGELGEIQTLRDTVIKDIEELDKEIKRLKEELNKLIEKESLIKNIDRLKEDITKTSNKIKKLRRDIIKLREKKKDYIEKKQKIQKKIHELQTQLFEFEEKYNLTTLTPDEKRKAILGLMEKPKSKRKRLEEELEKVRDEARKIELEIKNLESFLPTLSFQEDIVLKLAKYLKSKYNISSTPLFYLIKELAKEYNLKTEDLFKKIPFPGLENAIIIEHKHQVPLVILAVNDFFLKEEDSTPIHISIMYGNLSEIKEILREILINKEELDDIYKALETFDETIVYVNISARDNEEGIVVVHTFLNMKAIYLPWITAQTKKAQIEDKLRSLQKRYEETKKKIDSIKDKIKETLKMEEYLNRVLNLESELERLISTKLSPIEMNLSSIGQQIKEKDNEIKSHEREKERIIKEIKKLKAELGESENEIKRKLKLLPSQISSAERRKKKLESNLEEMNKRVEEKKKELDRIRVENEKIKALIEQMEKELNETVEKIEKYKENISPIEAEIKRLEIKIEGIDRDINLVESKISKILNVDKYKITSKISNINEEIKKTKDKIEKMKEYIEKLEKQVKKSGIKIENVRSMEEIDKEILRIQIILEEKYRGIDESLEREYENRKSIVSRLKRELDKLEEEKKSIQKYIDALKEKYHETLIEAISAIEETINKIFEETKIKKKCKLRYMHPSELNNEIGGIEVKIHHMGEEGKEKGVQTLSSGEYTLWVIGLIASLQRLNPSKIYVYDELLMHLDENNLKLATDILKSSLIDDRVIVLIVPLKTEDLKGITHFLTSYKIYLLWKSRGITETKLLEIPPYRSGG